MKIILMRLRITIAMLEIRNRETLQSKVNICKSDVKIADYADSLPPNLIIYLRCHIENNIDFYNSTPMVMIQKLFRIFSMQSWE